jgi:hypothetical protein
MPKQLRKSFVDTPLRIDTMPPSRSQRRRQPVRQPGLRQTTTRIVAPPDYSQDYTSVQRDLRWIALWGGLLFVGMIIAFFAL